MKIMEQIVLAVAASLLLGGCHVHLHVGEKHYYQTDQEDSASRDAVDATRAVIEGMNE